jgi:hypothetical protein
MSRRKRRREMQMTSTNAKTTENRSTENPPPEATAMADVLRRAAGLYLWVALFLAAPVGLTRDFAGAGALLAAYVGFVALTGAAVWKIGAEWTDLGRVRDHPAFLPGALLLSGPLALALGVFVTGEPTASRPGDYTWNTTAILLGTAILVSGFLALFARLWERGGRPLVVLGASGLLVGSALFVANLAFRYSVVAAGAAGLQAGAEDRAWVAHEYLGGLQGEPSWMELLLVWTDVLQLAFVSLAYLAAAAFGAALVRVGWLGKVGGGVFVCLNLALTLLVVAGLFLAGGGSTAAAWLVFVLTIPFMAFFLPYFLGLALISRSGRGERGAGVRA